MNIDQHYLLLRKHYRFIKEEETFPVMIDELERVFVCTRRNTQILIHKMREHNYIRWESGRGRGNSSKLTFLKPLHKVLIERAKYLTLHEKLEEAWKLTDQSYITKYEFTDWLYRHFGFQKKEDRDILRFPFYRPVLALDPQFVHRRTESDLVSQIFNTLVNYDSNKGVVPSIAHFWESDKNDTVWRFYLRKGVRFHHGKRMTAFDVEFTFKRHMKYSMYNEMRNTIQKITVIDTYIIEFTLHEPNVLFLNYLCAEQCSILPNDLDEINRNQSFALMPVGTGPFQIKKNNESVMILEANEVYFEGRPQLDAIEIWVWENFESSKLINRFEQEDIYFGTDSLNNELHTEKRIETGAFYLSINLQKNGPLADETLRKAIHYGLNREKMIQELGGSRTLPSCSFFPEYSKLHFKNEFDFLYAKQLITQSNYNGELLYIYTYEMESNIQNARWIQSQLIKIGLNVEVVILSIEKLAQPSILKEVDLIVSGEVLGTQPDVSLIEMFTNQSGFILNHISQTQLEWVKKTISHCKRETSETIRKDHLLRLQKNLAKSYQSLYLYHTIQAVQYRESLNGIMLNAWGKVDFNKIWIKRT